MHFIDITIIMIIVIIIIVCVCVCVSACVCVSKCVCVRHNTTSGSHEQCSAYEEFAIKAVLGLVYVLYEQCKYKVSVS